MHSSRETRSQNQARTELQDRAGKGAPAEKVAEKVAEGAKKSGGGKKLAKSLAMDFGGSAATAALFGLAAGSRRETPGQSRRATEAFEARSPAGL